MSWDSTVTPQAGQSAPSARRATLVQRLPKGARGQSLVEFGLVLPVLLLLVLLAIDFGRAYFAYISVTNAARNGAQYASANPAAAADLPEITDAALADTEQLPNTSATNPSVSVVTGTDSQGNQYADVTVRYDFDMLFSWPGLPGSIDIERTVRARVAP